MNTRHCNTFTAPTEIANQLKRKMVGVSRISIDYLQIWLVINEYG